MDNATFLLLGFVGFGLLIIGFIGYKVYTDKIIKEQERELAALETENKRLKGDYARKCQEVVKLKRIEPVTMQAIEMVDRSFIDALGGKDREFMNKRIKSALFDKFAPELEKLIEVTHDKNLSTSYAAAYRARLTFWVDTTAKKDYLEEF